MKKLIFGLVALALGTPVVAQEMCLQDQFGNQWNFTIDSEHNYLYGTVDVIGCEDPVWPVLGSFTRNPLVLELTAADPSPDVFGCDTSKLKGQYPNFAWYYEAGYGGQESAWVECGAPVERAADSLGGFRRSIQ